MRIGIRVHRHRGNAQLSTGAEHADGNLPAIGDQDLRDASHDALRFSRKARRPSWPSPDTRCAAMASEVSPAASDAPRAQTRGMRAFAREIASGPALRNSFT